MRQRIILAVLFFASGAGSLIYQVVWQRVLTQEIGIDAISAALIVATFMFGLGLGGALGGLLTRLNRPPLQILATIELIVGAYGLTSILLLRAFNAHLVPPDHLAVQLLMNGLLLLIPIIAMGATGPLMVAAWERSGGKSASIGYAYGANILGAAFGILIGGFYLIGTLGLTITTAIVALVDITLAVIFLILSRYGSSIRTLNRPAHPTSPLASERKTQDSARNQLWFASFLVGFCALAYEISYFRLFTTIFGLTAYVFPALIFAYLINMAMGTWLADRLYKPERATLLLVLFATLSIALTIPAILFLPFLESVSRQDALVMDPTLSGFSAWRQIADCLTISVGLMLPVASISALFPILVRENASLTSSTNDRAFASIYFIQTLGNTLGSIVAAFILFPLVGMLGAFGVAGSILGLGAIYFSWRTPNLQYRKLALGSASAVVVSWAIFTGSYDYHKSIKYYLTSTNAVSPARTIESVHGMTMLYDRGAKPNETYAVMASGRYYITGLVGPAADVSQFPAATEALAYAVNPNIKTILFIGLGTAHEVLTLKTLFPDAQVTVIEINPDLVQGIREFGHPAIASALNSAELHITDGRRYVQSLPSDKQFDYIHIGVARATAPGSANLFSADFLAKAKSHLAPNGVMTFNGYPNVTKAALSVFGDVAVSASSPDITQTIAVREPSKLSLALNSGDFAKNFAKAVQRLNGTNDSIFLNGGAFAGYEQKGWYLQRDQIEPILSEIQPSTDDLLATEYYLNQQTSILPARRRNSRPSDLRGWGSIDSAHPFPFPAAAQHVIDRSVRLDLANAATEILARGNQQHASILAPDRHLRISFDNFVRVGELAGRGWQWDLKTDGIPLRRSPGKAYVLEISAKKTGRGRWGAKAYCIKEGTLTALNLEETEDSALRTVRAFIVPDANSGACNFGITFDETAGIGSTADLKIESIRLIELSATPATN